jgi:glycosyltransferase A (GT-A) superfamily protein (DUF2064 family)
MQPMIESPTAAALADNTSSPVLNLAAPLGAHLLYDQTNGNLPTQVVLGPAVDGGFYLIGAIEMPENLLQVSVTGATDL